MGAWEGGAPAADSDPPELQGKLEGAALGWRPSVGAGWEVGGTLKDMMLDRLFSWSENIKYIFLGIFDGI